LRGLEITKAKTERAAVLEEDIEAAIESAEECPGECIYIEAQ
jgi:ferredoxin